MDYTLGYALTVSVFLLGIVGYWIVTRALRDPQLVYEPTTDS